ncbi:MAG TPA: endonuclease V [Gaiellaceae bacterium]
MAAATGRTRAPGAARTAAPGRRRRRGLGRALTQTARAWPADADELIALQIALAEAEPPLWQPPLGPLLVGGRFVCFERERSGAGAAGDRGWAAAALLSDNRLVATRVFSGAAGAAYREGLLALREGPLLAAAARRLPRQPQLLFVNAGGRDHPRRAGLALHLGAVLDVPTIGVTHRPLPARGEWPPDQRGATSPLVLEGELVGHWLRTRSGTRPLAVHAAWRTDAKTAVALVLAHCVQRTPEPIRQARRLAREARARSSAD